MKRKISLLENVVQEYEWGSLTAIPQLLGKENPDGRPMAEMWMGAHPKAPSIIDGAGGGSLLDAIAEDPTGILGAETAERFDGKLPFLFKVLAAGEPLSIQAHPNLQQAREGFARENSEGIDLMAFERNYRDDNHKPELICALTDFSALKGFRKIEDILGLFERLDIADLAGCLADLRENPDREGLKRFFSTLMTLDDEKRKRVTARAAEQALRLRDEDGAFDWILRLSAQRPEDIGILAPAILNLVELKPGQGLYQPAGELHSYLAGLGIELMANSDNVLRGGMTPKLVNVPELLSTLTFEFGDAETLGPETRDNGERVFKTPAREFILSEIRVKEGRPFVSANERSVEILLCVRGEGRIIEIESGEATICGKGVSALIPADIPGYKIEGDADVFKASVPL